ncbi:uncharacterized protein VTP21DRAFT_8613 [Calcarisporiella thermophila]|uniref:uncharacterized protein n=1 Tax=Calcarisporiella thermophila TaxID=911321 RepID=UPI0037421029
MAASKRLILLTILSLFLLILPSVLAWEEGDYEIFDLVDDLEAAEGKDTNFYSFLGVKPSSTRAEIDRAYRRRSIELHPDKNPGKKSQARFARLGVIKDILRDPYRRQRYDFFLKNGVPRWRGTGYYYRRHRPGLAFVLVFLTLLSSTLQYAVGWINFYQERKRIRLLVQDARSAMLARAGKRVRKNRVFLEDYGWVEVLNDGAIAFWETENECAVWDEANLKTPRVLDMIVFKLPVLVAKGIIGLPKLLTGKGNSRKQAKGSAENTEREGFDERTSEAEEDRDSGEEARPTSIRERMRERRERLEESEEDENAEQRPMNRRERREAERQAARRRARASKEAKTAENVGGRRRKPAKTK